MINRFSKAGLGTACFALLFGSAILILPLTPANAAPHKRPAPAAAVKNAKSKLAQAEPATTGSVAKTSASEQPACDRARRRLWVEGEGWVVRRVSTCY